MATLRSSREFWDGKAVENPYWYISTVRSYDDSDTDGFWNSGRLIWGELKLALSYAPGAGDTVVEVGCGLGRVTRAMAPEVARVHAFDISPEMLERAAEGVASPNITFHLTTGDSLSPVGNGAAALVLAYQVFQHLPSEQVLAVYLREMVRVAAPGGVIAFTTASPDWRARCLPLFRLRSFLRGGARGPRDLHRKEWTGIRPSAARIRALSPLPLQLRVLPGRRWFYAGMKPPLSA